MAMSATRSTARPGCACPAGLRRTRTSPNAALPRQYCAATAITSAERAVVILPGLGNSAGDYSDLGQLLSQRGVHVETAGVARVDWLRNAFGLRYPEYWAGNLTPRPTVDWYLNRIEEAVEAAKRAKDGAPITLLAHSAGGWMGRVYMKDFGTTGVDRFVSLGSPHNPPPKDVPGVIDQTRGILTWVEDNCPGAFQPNVSYTSIAGKFIKGAPISGGEAGVTMNQRIVGAGYQQVCGDAEEWGDGIVPVTAALLAGSEQLVLEGVYHSPVGAVDIQPEAEGRPNDDASSARPWYGSASVLDQWLHHACDSSAVDSSLSA